MERREHIEKLISKSDAQKKRSFLIQDVYEKYYVSGSDRDFEMLITRLDAYCISGVRKQLWKAGCYFDEIECTVMRKGRAAIWEILIEDRKTAVFRQNFADDAFKVYQRKTLHEIRKFLTKEKKTETISLNEFADDITAGNGWQELHEKLFLLYCRSFLESTAFPPKCLAFYYARVLPRLLRKIPDSKEAAQWAYGYIGNRTVGELREDSEDYLRNHVDKSFKWGKEFTRQLMAETNENGHSMILKDIIYTAFYDKREIEEWAEDMHKATVEEVMNMVLKDAELLESVIEYICCSDTLYEGVEKGNIR